MDPRERADAALARARARGAFVVTPESAVSPMDAASTLQIPRTVVAANDDRHDDPEATLVVPSPLVRARPTENVPAIAQEAATDMVATPPGMRSRQRRIEDAERLRQQRRPRPAPAPEAHTEELDGLIPTTKQPPSTPSTLSQRLEG
ncbi:hypothetical protein [Actinophytocola xanthii]|uniref:Uncharacterized protein n=1 Tax=Actinophytocola xanthii TaxID=1912961 RepID=A0A1Q8C1P3_9PSEU|nr:hypothetical protein [Actinophytocola xanthii]OLF08285.1 hypothetical protein BU204_34470 [Actinophytocola xanthii]